MNSLDKRVEKILKQDKADVRAVLRDYAQAELRDMEEAIEKAIEYATAPDLEQVSGSLFVEDLKKALSLITEIERTM